MYTRFVHALCARPLPRPLARSRRLTLIVASFSLTLLGTGCSTLEQLIPSFGDSPRAAIEPFESPGPTARLGGRELGGDERVDGENLDQQDSRLPRSQPSVQSEIATNTVKSEKKLPARVPSTPSQLDSSPTKSETPAPQKHRTSLFSIRWAVPSSAMETIKAFHIEYGPSPEQLAYSVRLVPQTLVPDPESNSAETVLKHAVSLPEDVPQLSIRISTENLDGVRSAPSAVFTSQRIAR